MQAGECLLSGLQIELRAAARTLSVAVLTAPGGEETTVIELNDTMLIVDRRRSSLTPDTNDSRKTHNWFPRNLTAMYAPLPPLGPSGQRELVVYVDGSAIEVFVDARVALTTLAFPQLAESTCVTVLAPGKEVPWDGAGLNISLWKLGDAMLPPLPV